MPCYAMNALFVHNFEYRMQDTCKKLWTYIWTIGPFVHTPVVCQICSWRFSGARNVCPWEVSRRCLQSKNKSQRTQCISSPALCAWHQSEISPWFARILSATYDMLWVVKSANKLYSGIWRILIERFMPCVRKWWSTSMRCYPLDGFFDLTLPSTNQPWSITQE